MILRAKAKNWYNDGDDYEHCLIKKSYHPGRRGAPYKEYLTAVENGNLEPAKWAAARARTHISSYRMGRR